MRDRHGKIEGYVEVFSTRGTNPFAGERRDLGGVSLVRHGPGFATLRRTAPEDVDECGRRTVHTLGVLFTDADHFKDVNDTFGHKTGDEVLRMVGQSLVNGLRHGDFPARWGGDEFLALLPGTDRAGLVAAAERVRMLAENSWIQKGEVQARVTVSVGATMAAPTETADDLVDRADRLMDASKRGGRNRVTTDTGTLTSHAEVPILGTALPWEMPAQCT